MRRVTPHATHDGSDRFHPHGGEDDQAEENRVTRSLAGMAVALLLVVASLFLVHTLQATARLEDCLMQGRGNCQPLSPDGR